MRSAAIVAAVAATGCATLFAGGPDEVPITTNPPGAYVYLDGQVVGRTPLVVTLDRNRTLGDLRIYYPGFLPATFHLYKSFNWWTIGNFFIGLIPIVVDLATGNWQQFDDSDITLTLAPGQAPPPYGVQPQEPRPPQSVY